MAAKIKSYDEIKLFKITCLDLKDKTKERYKEINPTPINWVVRKLLWSRIMGP
jgi:hypothetical protein